MTTKEIMQSLSKSQYVEVIEAFEEINKGQYPPNSLKEWNARFALALSRVVKRDIDIMGNTGNAVLCAIETKLGLN